jgi:acyl carrier protein
MTGFHGDLMQTYEDILGKLIDAVSPLVPEGRELTEETDIVDDLDLDSMRVMELVLALEDSLDISVPLNILPQVRTVKDFALQLQQLIEQGP